MLNLESALYRFLAESNPGNIPLSHMKYTGGIICKIMYLSFHHRLKIFLPYSLSFKSRTERYRNINLFYSNLKTSYFYSFCNDFIIVNIRNYMLICTYPSWKYLGDRGISYGRKPIIYSTGSICIFFFIYFTQSQHKCKHPVFIIKKHSPIVSRLNPAKTQSSPC